MLFSSEIRTVADIITVSSVNFISGLIMMGNLSAVSTANMTTSGRIPLRITVAALCKALSVGIMLVASLGTASVQANGTRVNELPVGGKEQRIIANGEAAVAAEQIPVKLQDYRDFPTAVELYSDDELNQLIRHNTHLQRVKADDCQLVDDIKARAELVKLPAYQFLWGDMLAWGVCVEADAELGMYYIRAAAQQAQPRALEQLGRYYVKGQFVQQDIARGLPLLQQSAQLGFLPAKLQWAQLLVQGYGSPYDYQAAYTSLYASITGDSNTHSQLRRLLTQLASMMPSHVVEAAKKQAKYN